MKAIYFLHNPLPLAILLLLPLAAPCQTPTPPQIMPAGDSATLSGVVATVGRYKITRQQVIEEWLEVEPDVKRSYLDATGQSVFTPHNFTLTELETYGFAQKKDHIEAVLQNMMIRVALEEAAAQRHIEVPEEKVRKFVHENLEVRRKSAQLPPTADEELAIRFKENLHQMQQTARQIFLQQALVAADLAEQLGHAPEPSDFYSVHMIYLPAALPADPLSTGKENPSRVKLEKLRADIVSGKQKFEDAARKESTDNTAQTGGNLGVLPRTLLRKPLEEAILALKPGELTPSMPSANGFVLFRLDKRGADLTQAERDSAVSKCSAIERRKQEAMARTLKDVKWSTTVGKAPEWFREMPRPAQ